MVDDGRTDDGQTTDGRTTEHGYTISSPCEPDGSGELMKWGMATICVCAPQSCPSGSMQKFSFANFCLVFFFQ